MAVKWNDTLVKRCISAAEDGVSDATNAVYEEVLRLVLDTPKSGKIYKRKGRNHQASAPNESYANDTGNALNNTKHDSKKLVGEVVGNYEYALALELGTQKMAPRPTIGRALNNLSKSIPKIMASPITKVLKDD